jgi:hypothetical protein
LKGTRPADSAGRRPKQCSTLFAAARLWPVSAIMFLAVWMLNRQIYAQPQLGTSASSYEAQGYGTWAGNSIQGCAISLRLRCVPGHSCGRALEKKKKKNVTHSIERVLAEKLTLTYLANRFVTWCEN